MLFKKEFMWIYVFSLLHLDSRKHLRYYFDCFIIIYDLHVKCEMTPKIFIITNYIGIPANTIR